jgi:Sodium/hydrogen exchanger family.
MNARGLMELIVIRIGFDAGLIGPELFTLLFAMTLITTLMSSPLLSLFYGRGRLAAGTAAHGLQPDR